MKNFKEVRQGLTEERMNLSSRLYKQFKKDIDKIMKKHDAYVSDSNTKYTTISSPKPMKGAKVFAHRGCDQHLDRQSVCLAHRGADVARGCRGV